MSTHDAYGITTSMSINNTFLANSTRPFQRLHHTRR